MKKASLFLVCIILLSISCQKDTILFEAEKNNKISKSYTLDGDYRWNLLMPSILGTHSDGLLTLPENWNALPNRYLVFYAHGMVEYDYPVVLPNDFIGDKSIEQFVKEMGMGYATTSYGANGLVAHRAVEEVRMLVLEVNKIFEDHSNPMQEDYIAPPDNIFLVGYSEGGLTTVLTIERYADLFDGAISICGPIGSFYDQLQYWGDFNVLFNYFFEEDLRFYHQYIGNPQDGVGDSTIQRWNEGVRPLELQWLINIVLEENPEKVKQLLQCARIKLDKDEPDASHEVIFELLRYNVKLTNEIITRFFCPALDNVDTWYSGSYDDTLLNNNIQRVSSPSLKELVMDKDFQPTGLIDIPLINIHNTNNPIIPYWHTKEYKSLIKENKKKDLYTEIKVKDFGHSTLQASYLTDALSLLIEEVNK